MNTQIQAPVQYRELRISSGAIDRSARTVGLTFSSEAPYPRSWGVEILSHKPGALVADRLKRGAVPFLLNHNWDEQIGTIVQYGIRNAKGFAVAKLSRNDKGEEILKTSRTAFVLTLALATSFTSFSR
jgi:hypothetical protein